MTKINYEINAHANLVSHQVARDKTIFFDISY